MPELDSFTIIPTSASTAECDPIIIRETGTTRLVFKPLLIKNPNDTKASVKGCFVFQRKGAKTEWVDRNAVSLSKLRADEWIKLELTSEELLGFVRNLGGFYRANAKYGLPREKVHFIKVSATEGGSDGLSRLDFRRLFDISRRTGVDAVFQLLGWLTESENAAEVLGNLKRLDISTLHRLKGLVGLAGLKAALTEWCANEDNPSEQFWQDLFERHSFILSEVFCLPVFVFQNKAYVGGKSVSNTGGHIVDFLAANLITKNCALIEIKTPSTKLLGRRYRADVYSGSEELTGGVAQVLNYRLNLVSQYATLVQGSSSFAIFAPQCVLVAGHAGNELKDENQRRSFELTRADHKNVQIVTFDELFAKTEALISALESGT